ncbi:MAG: NAD(P)-dependent oxidoreductase [Candidatus Aminicenantes bacterium]|nr:NAD(P)-dependent oxidoreductase [Candidatus Aminicenantes bacterium]
MKILVIGGTGLVGSYLLPRLVANKNEVYALTRSEGKIEGIQKLGAHGILGDIRNLREFDKNLPDRLDMIVLLAMPDVKPGHRMTRKRKAELREETNDFFHNAMDLAIRYNAPIILPGGTSYRTEKDEIADETWPVLRTGLTEIGADTDEMVNQAIKTNRPRVIQLIYGKIYGNGGLFRFMYEMMAKGRSKIIGKGENFIPNIHASDAAAAIIKASEKMPVGEKFIIADDTPVTQKNFAFYMAALMNKKRPGHIPGFVVKLVLGKDFYEIVRMNCKVSNAKAKKILDWHPEYPSYKNGLEATISEMKEKKNYFA